ncbi:CvfB family protein [Marinoscillum furvescens]|uniref:GntR family transcriptional regulator n=1 Tax=Marinoscillum furvescens DSM 4134 TaxID=1122208 RepID=A0A3D9KYB6_MARFU|nr:S1-like domain-containing RNA-binding protein [Marinoscillum furvescens]RED92058.1 hypothetical protein C7460_13327 [Marinoscillum furvescens DSM 4134]
MALPIIEIGKVNTLKVLKQTEQGLYVGDDVEEILLPNKYIPEEARAGDMLDVFIYTDSEDRLIATTLTPKIQRDEFAYLKVKETTRFGAFLDWGLEKDLLVPFKEQLDKMYAGESYLVYMYLDDVTDRLVASSHLNKFLETEDIDLEEGESVEILIGEPTDIGYQCIVNDTYKGLVYKNEVFKAVQPGDRTMAYVKQVRPDKKIDLSLEPIGYESIEPNADKVMKQLRSNDGYLSLHDKSDPEAIKNSLQMSKKVFKKAIGALYKKRLIELEQDGIRLKK